MKNIIEDAPLNHAISRMMKNLFQTELLEDDDFKCDFFKFTVIKIFMGNINKYVIYHFYSLPMWIFL